MVAPAARVQDEAPRAELSSGSEKENKMGPGGGKRKRGSDSEDNDPEYVPSKLFRNEGKQGSRERNPGKAYLLFLL